MKEIPIGKCAEAGGQVQQCDQDKERGSGLAGYTMWKSDTKLVI